MPNIIAIYHLSKQLFFNKEIAAAEQGHNKELTKKLAAEIQQEKDVLDRAQQRTIELAKKLVKINRGGDARPRSPSSYKRAKEAPASRELVDLERVGTERVLGTERVDTERIGRQQKRRKYD